MAGGRAIDHLCGVENLDFAHGKLSYQVPGTAVYWVRHARGSYLHTYCMTVLAFCCHRNRGHNRRKTNPFDAVVHVQDKRLL